MNIAWKVRKQIYYKNISKKFNKGRNISLGKFTKKETAWSRTLGTTQQSILEKQIYKKADLKKIYQ